MRRLRCWGLRVCGCTGRGLGVVHSAIHFNIRCVFVGSIGSDCNPIRTVIFSCLTKTDIAIGLAMFCKQRSFGTPRTVHHTKSCLKLSFYRSIRIYRGGF